MKGTSISWTDDTWNVSDGCTKVSPGCKHCYAERMAKRFAGPGKPYMLVINEHGRWNNTVQFRPDRLTQPMHWKEPRKIFVNSMSDLFHEDLTNQQIAAVFGVMAACHQHTFQVLTKRSERRLEWFKWVDHAAKMMAPCDYENPWWRVLVCLDAMCTELDAPLKIERDGRLDYCSGAANRYLRGVSGATWPLRNVWQGTSVENQGTANQRIPLLLQTAASVRFLSMEPLLEMIDLTMLNDGSWYDREGAQCYRDGEHGLGGGPRIDWVIAGCESGPGARPCDVAWLRSLRDQCAAAGVAFFLKQAVEHNDDRFWEVEIGGDDFISVQAGPGSRRKPGGVIELPYLDGVQHAKFPEGSDG